MTTKTLNKLEPDTKAFITEAIQDIVSDPDFGLELSDEVKKRLAKAKKSPRKTVPLSEIKKEYL